MTTEVEEKIYTQEELLELDPSSIPEHVAIAMDGNRRWAKKRFLPAIAGHWRGADTLMRVVEAAAELGIKVLTVYTFSTENWRRSSEEKEALFLLFQEYLTRWRNQMADEGVRVDTIGDLSRFSQDLCDVLEETKRVTSEGTRIQLVLAMNYGGRDDIRRAIRSILDDYCAGKVTRNGLTEEVIADYLDTAKWGDPQLLIRTGGELRVSNFLIWQISYAELYITDVLWPDFNEKELLKSVLAYQQRKRRMGG